MEARLIQTRVLDNPYIPHRPTDPQRAFLALPVREAGYGGSAGSGKSDGLLAAALMYVDVPGYNAILFRQSYTDLTLPEALIPRSHEWLAPTDAKWNGNDHAWTFPSGATVSFSYLEHPNDRFRYQGAAFQFVGFDELTQHLEVNYRYLFSRLRRLAGMPVPIRMRWASNPGGIGHEWVKQRFITEGTAQGRVFIRAKLADNPYLDRDEYIQSLNELDPFTRAQLLAGDWDAKPPGHKFQREWFEIVDQAPAGIRPVRFWDLAATEPKPGKDPDWTAGCKVGLKDGVYYVFDMRRTRTTPHGVEQLIRQTAELDGRDVEVFIEEEGGSAGKNTTHTYRNRVLVGFAAYGERATGSKEVRANPVSSAAEAGNVKLVRGPWITAFLDEAESFPGGAHDDQVDALSGGVKALTDRPSQGVY